MTGGQSPRPQNPCRRNQNINIDGNGRGKERDILHVTDQRHDHVLQILRRHETFAFFLFVIVVRIFDLAGKFSMHFHVTTSDRRREVAEPHVRVVRQK